MCIHVSKPSRSCRVSLVCVYTRQWKE